MVVGAILQIAGSVDQSAGIGIENLFHDRQHPLRIVFEELVENGPIQTVSSVGYRFSVRAT